MPVNFPEGSWIGYVVNACCGAIDSRNWSTVSQSGTVTTGDDIAADTGTERRIPLTAAPVSSELPADSRNQPMNAIQIPFRTAPVKSSNTPNAIIRYAKTRPILTAL